MEDLVTELLDTFREQKNFYVDGKMLSMYLYTSGEKFELNGVKYDKFNENKQYNSLEGSIYKVERIGRPYEGYLKVKYVKNGEPHIFKTLLKVDKIIKYKSIAINIFVLLVGILLYLIYEKRLIDLKGN
jgi:hypothetical protein